MKIRHHYFPSSGHLFFFSQFMTDVVMKYPGQLKVALVVTTTRLDTFQGTRRRENRPLVLRRHHQRDQNLEQKPCPTTKPSSPRYTKGCSPRATPSLICPGLSMRRIEDTYHGTAKADEKARSSSRILPALCPMRYAASKSLTRTKPR